MLIAIFGESCTGKSTIANEIAKKTGALLYTGKDYIRLAKNEADAQRQFAQMLESHTASADTMIYVITEKEHMAILPDKALRVLVCAELDTIKQRFAARMNGKLPAAVAAMLEKRHGMFDSEKHDLRIDNAGEQLSAISDRIIELCGM